MSHSGLIYESVTSHTLYWYCDLINYSVDPLSYTIEGNNRDIYVSLDNFVKTEVSREIHYL
jgi:hypothetical protein